MLPLDMLWCMAGVQTPRFPQSSGEPPKAAQFLCSMPRLLRRRQARINHGRRAHLEQQAKA